MDACRELAAAGEPDGTVIAAGFQEKGRGRKDRIWQTVKNQNLMFTVLFRYQNFTSIPKAFTLRAGLAASLSIEDLLPDLAGLVKIKWPNDIMLVPGAGPGKTAAIKAAGILTESDGANVYLGIGVNVLQTEFPPELTGKAASLLSFYKDRFPDRIIPESLRPRHAHFLLLEKILARLYTEFKTPQTAWKTSIEDRLFKLGEQVIFARGAADSQNLVRGRLEGITDSGELLIFPNGEKEPRAFINGELEVYSDHF